MNLGQAALLAVAATAAGAINSIAGGGSLITFPAGLAVGLSPLVANATNSVGLAPGAFGAAYAYRREIGRDRGVVRRLAPAAIVGSIAGSALLLSTPQAVFDTIVPLLVLFATLLLLVPKRAKKAQGGDAEGEWELPKNPVVLFGIQLLIGLYGGYFGAGIGIMMLALFGALGSVDIHRKNGVKTVLAAIINGVAAVAFVVAGAVDYRAAALLAVFSTAGGLLGGGVARRVRPALVRGAVVVIGLCLSGVLAYRRFHS